MNKERVNEFELRLKEYGYKKYSAQNYDNFEYYFAKTIKSIEGKHLYVICFRLWDFAKYDKNLTEPMSYDVQFVLPADVTNYAIDFTISYHDKLTIEEIENIGNNWFNFCLQSNLAEL